MVAQNRLNVVLAGDVEDPGAVRPAVDEIADGEDPVRCLRFEQLQHPPQFHRAAVDIAEDEGPARAGRKIPDVQRVHGRLLHLRRSGGGVKGCHLPEGLHSDGGMDWSVGKVSSASTLSGETFEEGERVCSLLFLSPEGGLERVDVREEERDHVGERGRLLCRWTHQIKPRVEDPAEERRAALQSAEESFLALYEDTEEEAEEETDEATEAARERLKFILSLQLERKRVLRPLGKGRYLHVATKREYEVPQLPLTPELVRDLKDDLL